MIDRVRCAVVGLGFMGGHYARILAQTPNAELVAVCDALPDNATRVAAASGVPGYADLGSLLAAHPGVDAVFITTPEADHVEPAILAAAARKHLFIEKPLAVTLADCERISAACRAAGVTLMVGHHSRFDPRFGELARAIVEGTLGRVTHLYARRNMYSASADRIRRRVTLTLWAGPHDIDAMLWLTGGRVARVFGRAVSLNAEPGIPDAMVAVLTLADGRIGIIEYSWVAPPLQGNPERFSFEVVGSGGFAELAYGNGGLNLFTPTAAIHPDMMFFPRVGDRWTGQYREQALYFLDCLLLGKAPIVDAVTATEVVRVALAIDASVAEGREIDL